MKEIGIGDDVRVNKRAMADLAGRGELGAGASDLGTVSAIQAVDGGSKSIYRVDLEVGKTVWLYGWKVDLIGEAS